MHDDMHFAYAQVGGPNKASSFHTYGAHDNSAEVRAAAERVCDSELIVWWHARQAGETVQASALLPYFVNPGFHRDNPRQEDTEHSLCNDFYEDHPGPILGVAFDMQAHNVHVSRLAGGGQHVG